LLQLVPMSLDIFHVFAVFAFVFLASIFSGMAGGGGGMITIPFLIALGLSPQQAIATNKFIGFGVGVGATAAFKRKALENPKLLTFLLIVAVSISLIVPHLFRKFSENFFQVAIGIIMLALIPVVLSEKNGLRQIQTSKMRKIIGGIFIAVVFLFQGLFSSGIGSLNNIVLMSFFGLPALTANAVRRVSTMALNTFIIITLIATTNFIIAKYAVAGISAGLIGSYIGSRMALKRGEKFAKYALALFMLVSGIILLLTAGNNT
jgi:uncharacterized membrane protein YfcA